MENILFKPAWPAEFHAQTAVEAALRLHPRVRDRLDDIDRIRVETQASADRIINKTGPLANPADRDHCLQYMVAVALLKGGLEATDYADDVAGDPQIDALRERMTVTVEERFSRHYLDPGKRAVGNAVQVFFRDGTASEKVSIGYPVGHPRRRDEGIPLLRKKFERHLEGAVKRENAQQLLECCSEQGRFEQATVDEIMSLLVV